MKILKRIIFFIVLLGNHAFAQFNKELIEEKLNTPLKSTIAETLIEMGESFLGKPYLGSTLEGPEEKLVCRIDAFDCYTFVENVLALSLTKHSKNKTYENYIKQLQALRYRNGKIDGYASRVHYFSEWAKLAEKRHILQDLSPVIGVEQNKQFDFMSTHRFLYPTFAKDNEVYERIVKMEQNLDKYQLHHLKKEFFTTYQHIIKTGDIIAFTSKTPGLDVNHEGFAYWKNGKLLLMHASIEKKKVIISEETILNYLKRINKHEGIMLLRVNEVRN